MECISTLLSTQTKMASSKAFLVIGCLLLVLLVASEVAAKDVPQESSEIENESVHVEDAKYGGRGGGRRCQCCRCCRSAQEKMTFEDMKHNGGGYSNHGGYNNGGRGGGGGRRCYHGCCGHGCC